MVHTVSWMVMRESDLDRSQAQRVVTRWFLLGGAVGGALAGAFLALGAQALTSFVGPSVLPVVAALVAVAYAGAAAGWWRLPRLQRPNQVPESWREILGTRAASFAYSSVLGFTFLTQIRSFAVYPLVFLSLDMGVTPSVPIALFGLAGFLRAATVFIVPWLGLTDKPGEHVVATLDGLASRARAIEAIVLVASACIIGVGVLA